jgi:hypothetical protein
VSRGQARGLTAAASASTCEPCVGDPGKVVAQNAFFTVPETLGNATAPTQLSGTGWDQVGCQYAVGMSEATPTPIEPPTPSAEQLAEWQALIERIRQGDRSQVLAWDEVAAAGTRATYQVL